MLVAAELDYFKSRRELEKVAQEVEDAGIDLVDIPDLPLGAKRSSPVAAAFLSSLLGPGRVIAHIRTVDHAPHSIKGIARTLLLLGVDRLVLLRGDPLGGESGPAPEEAFKLVAKYRSDGLKLGFIVSLRKSRDEIRRRLSLGPDFILALNAGEEHLWIVEEAHSYGAEVLVYVILRTRENEALLSGRVSSKSLGVDEALRFACRAAERGATGVLLSSPGSWRSILEVAGLVKRECG